jgi:hypothetical protein
MTTQQEEYIKAFCTHMNKWKRKESLPISGIALNDRLILFSRSEPPQIDLQRVESVISKSDQEINAMFEGDLLFIWKDENSQWNAFSDACQIFGYIANPPAASNQPHEA